MAVARLRAGDERRGAGDEACLGGAAALEQGAHREQVVAQRLDLVRALGAEVEADRAQAKEGVRAPRSAMRLVISARASASPAVSS